MVTILAGLATFERHLIKTRTSEGRARAKLRGVRFGRKPSLTQFQIDEALKRREAGETLADIGRTFGLVNRPSLDWDEKVPHSQRCVR
jgi:DNA invertase Pin-like site-specific DNA recombinase